MDLGHEIKFDPKGSIGPFKGSPGVAGGLPSPSGLASLTIDLLNPISLPVDGRPPFPRSRSLRFLQGSTQLQPDAGIQLALEAVRKSGSRGQSLLIY